VGKRFGKKLENELEKDEARIKQQKQQLAATTTGNKPTVVKTNSDQVNKEKSVDTQRTPNVTISYSSVTTS